MEVFGTEGVVASRKAVNCDDIYGCATKGEKHIGWLLFMAFH